MKIMPMIWSIGILIMTTIIVFTIAYHVSEIDTATPLTNDSVYNYTYTASTTVSPVGEGITSSTITTNINSSLSFDGVNDKVTQTTIIPSGTSSSGDRLTVSFWLNTNSNITNKRIMGREEQFLFLWNAGKPRLIAKNNSKAYNLDFSYKAQIGKWVHLVGQSTGTQTKLYVNGALNVTGTGGALVGLNTTTQAFEIGCISTSCNNGSLDEVYIINDSLTAKQIERLYLSSDRVNGVSVAVVNYHQIENADFPATVVNLTEFTEQMALLNSTGANTITYKDLILWKNNQFTMPQNPVIISFDDDKLNAYTNATPIMDAYGFVGVMAVISQEVGNAGYMSWAQIRDLESKGWEIASHSINATSLLSMTQAQRLSAYQTSKDEIEGNITGYTVTSFIFPGGYRNATTDNECAGYYSVCGAEALSESSARYIYKNSNLTSTIPRMTVQNYTTIAQFEDMIDYKSNAFTIYKFNEANGTTAYDSSGNGNNGVISGATWQTSGTKTLTSGVDYTFTSLGAFTLLNTDYLYNWINLAWTYDSSKSSAITNITNNFASGVDNVSKNIPIIFSVIILIAIVTIITIIYYYTKYNEGKL